MAAGDLAGRTVLLTGAAGGLGLETSLAFIEAGATLVAIDNDPVKAAALEAAAHGRGPGRLVLERLDLSDLPALARELGAVSDRVGGFDAVINNAGIYPAKPFEEFTIEEHQAVQRVNVDAGIVCVQAALPHMRERGWGRIVNISSVTLWGGWANLSPYVASKAALVGLTRAWAREFGPYGVTVNAIAPGAFPTDAEKIHPDPEGYTRFVLERQALKRRGHPRDIAEALLFLASDKAGFITGQTISVDGGWVMH
jgi:NAD(P)-dependent dehydrogenase (short-subunit alcohol dehydrogenase family)